MDDRMNDVIDEVQKILGEEFRSGEKIGMLQRYVTGLVNQLMRL